MAEVDAHLDLAYTCSKWTYKKGTPEEVVASFVEVTNKESDVVRATIPNRLNVRYGEGERQLYDLYGTDLPQGSSVLIFIHGGYWQAISKESSANLVTPLYNEGFRVMVVDYDLCPNVKLTKIIEEIRELYNVVLNDPEFLGADIWLSGHSAGAHLCSVYLDSSFLSTFPLEQRDRVKGMVLICGVFDVVPLLQTTKNDKLKLDSEEAVLASTVKYFSNSTFKGKIILTVGEAESPEFHQQSIDVHEAALKSGIPSEYFVTKNECHFTAIEKLNDPNFEVTRKIISFIKS